MKKTAIFSFMLAIVLVFSTGCGVFDFLKSDKTFSKSGMSITLTESFYEKENVAYTAYYESPLILVFAIKEDLSYFEGMNLTLSDYAQLVIYNNSLSCDVIEDNDLTYFIFEKEVNGKNYLYFAPVYKSSDAYWLIQFACESANYEELKDTIIKYAQSVTFDSDADAVSNITV